ncbi:2-keto-4-pentenoate hydratase [Stella sp.]|uniref:2-keto-4-pentenoate hydratase n=1 Tax=Stella sp. TaxID=2912054 RepID=UPI0035B12029
MTAAAARLDTAAAAALLREHWRTGRKMAALPAALRPAGRVDGYAIQAELEAPGLAPVAGWKIAATSRAGQLHIGVDGPMAGRLPADRVLEPGATIDLAGNLMRVAEVEFVFRMAATLAPRSAPYGRGEVMAAVGALHTGIEIPDSRFEDFARVGAAQLIADDACAHLFVLGPACPDAWRSLDLAAERPRAAVGGRYEREGLGANVLGDPRDALVWIANELSGIGVPLRAGQFVTTGTCVAPLEVRPGDTVLADYGMLGTISATFR